MAPPSPDLTLYLVTDSSLLPPGTTLPEHVRACIKGGVTVVQLREKKLSTAKFISLGNEVHAVTKELGVPLLINDRVDVALAVGCEGVHVGWDDMECQTARKILGPDAIIGLSVSNREQLAKALGAGPTYLGVGPVYATPTKPDHNTPLGLDGLQQLLEDIPGDLPCCAIGGINVQNASAVMDAFRSKPSPARPLEGLAIVSAIMSSSVPTETCMNLRSLITPKKADLTSDLLRILRGFRQRGPPLVHHITNNVSKTLHANVTLAIGASPIMSENDSEFFDLAELGECVSLVLNMGTFLGEETTKRLFRNAIEAHSKCRNFIVFDPVGAGATGSRREFARAIQEISTSMDAPMVIKGNEGEILTLAGEAVSMRGVDGAGAGGGGQRERELAVIVSTLSKKNRGQIIVMTGSTDIISNGETTFLLRNGDPIQTMVTGIGCVLSSAIAAIHWGGGRSSHEKLLAAVAAVSFFNLSAELAVSTEPRPTGPASWAVRFVDMLSKEPTEDFVRQFRIEEIKV